MGCCNEKLNLVKNKYHQLILSEEETVIKMREKSLPFSSVKLQDLEDSLLRNETNGMLSIAQLRKAMTELDFEVEIFTDPEEHIITLLKVLQNSKRLYDHKTIMLFGTVLGIGTPREKALKLFSLYDSNKCKFLTYEQTNEMLCEVVEVSVNKIPMIAVDDSEDPQKFTVSEKVMARYVSSLLDHKDKFITTALKMIVEVGGRVTEEEFVRKVAGDSLLESLVWSYQMRLALIE